MAAKKLRGKWVACFSFRGQRIRYVAPVQTKKGAEEYERQLRTELLTPTPVKQSKPTFAAFWKRFWREYVELENKPTERRKKDSVFRNWLEPEFGPLELDAIDEAKINAFRAKLAAKLKPRSANNTLVVLSRVLRYAHEIRVLTAVPSIRYLRGGQDPEWRFLDFEETQRFLAVIKDAVWRAYVLTAIRTGLRYSELAELKWSDLDLLNRMICVTRCFVEGHIGPPKNGRSRTVSMTPQVVDVLMGIQHKRSEFVFALPDGGRLSHKAVRGHLSRYSELAALGKIIRPHDLRHTCASHLAMLGRAPQEIQAHLGHRNLTQTQRYMHLSPRALREGVDELDGINHGGTQKAQAIRLVHK